MEREQVAGRFMIAGNCKQQEFNRGDIVAIYHSIQKFFEEN
jgi:hypothetical protein